MEKTDFLEIIKEYSKKAGLFSPNDKILVTLSGGADSVALLKVLLQMGVQCVAAHCNFHLRGEESMRDEQFVRQLCQQLQVECVVKDFDVVAYVEANKVSVEMACRELRYEWFEQLRCEQLCDYIAVAHHHDDNIETFFLNMLRGTGIAGLAGIKPKSGRIIRPLLCVRRLDVEEYLTKLDQKWIVDSTNNENEFKRNAIRNEILPFIRKRFQGADVAMARTLQNVMGCNEFYQGAVQQAKNQIVDNVGENVVRVDMQIIKQYAGYPTLLFEILKQYGYNSDQTNQIVKLWSEDFPSGQIFQTESHYGVANRRYFDIINKTQLTATTTNFELKEGVIECGKFDIKISRHPIDTFNAKDFNGKTIICLSDDAEKVKQLKLRHWQEGDRIAPFGMKGTKLVSDVFNDLKLSEVEKRLTWILEADGEILWVVKYRASSRYKTTQHNSHFYRIEIVE